MRGKPVRRLGMEQLEDRTTPATLPTGFHETLLATGLSGPTSMELAPDGRMFVTEQAGAVRIISNGELLSTPFLKLSVDSQGERGLLGIAFDPNFNTNHFVYVYYTVPTAPAHNRVSRFTANGDSVVPGSEVVLMDLEALSPATNHNGGGLHFGTDGKLYIGVGENANGANSQTLTNKLGKILRINSDGSIPSDNPFVGVAGAQPSVWALGLRNPFTFGVQPGTGRLFIDDVGQNSFEEIDDGAAGANYGWPNAEGFGGAPTYVDPIFAYSHGNSNTQGNAITGGTFYNPATNQFGADYQGDYFFADLTSGWIRRLDTSTNTATLFATDLASLPVDLDVDSGGNLYYLSRGFGSNTGVVYRIDRGVETPEQHYVAELYQDFLGRTGSTAELEGWVQQLPTARRSGLVAGIERSTEALQRLVQSYYTYYLGRTASVGELSPWVNQLQQGRTAEQVAAGFLASGEFAARANTLEGTSNADENYVRALYRLLLQRTGSQISQAEVNYWKGQLAVVGRGGVANGFLNSSEFRAKAVRAMYGQPSTPPLPFVPNLLNRSVAPSNAEVQGWVNSGLDLLRLEQAIGSAAENFANG